MKSDLRILLRDLKAAARIGHSESIWAALDGLLDTPQLAGNHPLDEPFLKQVVLPVGRELAAPLLPPAALRPLIMHPNAGMRAIAGTALAERYLKGLNGAGLKDLAQLAQDARPDVREAILLACALPGTSAPEKQTEIFQSWLMESSPRLQALALRLLPHLPEAVLLEQLPRLEIFAPPQEPGAKRALADAVSKLGEAGLGLQVLAILSAWAENPGRYYWVITRALSRSWAATYPKESLAILTRLAAEMGGRKQILNTLQALERHGAKTEVQDLLQAWRGSGQPQLQSAAQKAEEKSGNQKDHE